MPLARRGDEGIVSQLAALGVEVPHQKQTGALFDRTGKELAVLVPEQILLFLQIPGKLPLGNAQLLGGGADVGAVRRVNKGVVILRFGEGKPETAAISFARAGSNLTPYQCCGSSRVFSMQASV